MTYLMPIKLKWQNLNVENNNYQGLIYLPLTYSCTKCGLECVAAVSVNKAAFSHARISHKDHLEEALRFWW